MPPAVGQGPLGIDPFFYLFATPETGDQAHTESLIGIAVAVGGNILISLALNCQKLAHKRLDLEKQCHHRRLMQRGENGEDNAQVSLADAEDPVSDETRLFMGDRRDSYESYTTPRKTRTRTNIIIPRDADSPRRRSGLGSGPIVADTQDEEVRAVAIEVTGRGEDQNIQAKQTDEVTINEGAVDPEYNETEYLRSKLWWFGLCLMNLGEFGNFLSYAYAPASVVAPLGTVALIANCFFAPLMLKEKLRKCDLLGVILAIFGAVTIVGAGKSSDVRLDPAGLIRAISRRPFVIYATICVALIVCFGILSAGPAGRKWVVVDVGLCALFGGFTVLATKAISTLLSLHWIEIFEDWITYPILGVLVFTGIGQIKYLNRALMKFDSKVVIPTFFVSFNLSAIVGSAILYGDFENMRVHQFTTFLYGCATTFLGVFFLTRSTGEAGAALEEAVRPESIAEDGGEHARWSGTRGTRFPHSLSRGTPFLRVKNSTASLVLSAGQYLLLAASPPRERVGSPIERPAPLRNQSNIVESPASLSRGL
ncbi:magnesium transporter NIPA-domain-containing protein [Gautieria morchelliformis]|nr:magnesium transporter NIPA-domain-containing protein [Gautieria morchelliformis]